MKPAKKIAKSTSDARYLDGQLLVAMPIMTDTRFQRSVIYVCAHSEEGAMGLIVNQPAPKISLSELLKNLAIDSDDGGGGTFKPDALSLPIQTGGPVESGRGFVLHSPDYFIADATLAVEPNVSLTATIDILKAIAAGHGPSRAILALGYAGWSPGQLESEIQHNGWLTCPADPDIVFDANLDKKYETALAKLGVSLPHLVSDAGNC